jgi:hypothetical protein
MTRVTIRVDVEASLASKAECRSCRSWEAKGQVEVVMAFVRSHVLRHAEGEFG